MQIIEWTEAGLYPGLVTINCCMTVTELAIVSFNTVLIITGDVYRCHAADTGLNAMYGTVNFIVAHRLQSSFTSIDMAQGKYLVR